jgi:hypothetical protein
MIDRSPLKLTHINFFDFDETLYRVPTYASRDAGSMSPYEWYDNPISLDPELNPRLIQTVAGMIKPMESINYIISKRDPACKPGMINLIEKDNLELDGVYALGRTCIKSEIIEALTQGLINQGCKIQNITIWEDSMFEIMHYVYNFTSCLGKIRIDYKFIDKARIFTFDRPSLLGLFYSHKPEKLEIKL